LGFAVKWHLASFPGLKKKEREREGWFQLFCACARRERERAGFSCSVHVLAIKHYTLLIYFMIPK